jgi:hypothetical protein
VTSLSSKGAFESIAPESADAVFVVLRREHRKGARWRIVGRAATWAAAVAMIQGAGDWHISEREPAPSQEGAECRSSTKTELR